jgi:hypothetical protein
MTKSLGPLRFQYLQGLLEVVVAHVGDQIPLPMVRLRDLLNTAETMSQHASAPDPV